MKTIKIKPGTVDTGLQKSTSSGVSAQNIQNQSASHGNSLALTKECIYCIAKKICLQSTLPKACKTNLAQRFEKLNPVNETKHGVSSSSSDNTWAKQIVVKIFQDETERTVETPTAVLRVDASSS